MLIIDLKQDTLKLSRTRLRRYASTLVNLMENMVEDREIQLEKDRLRALITDYTLTLVFLYLSIGFLFWSIPFSYNNGIWFAVPMNVFTTLACSYICARESSELRKLITTCRELVVKELSICNMSEVSKKKETKYEIRKLK